VYPVIVDTSVPHEPAVAVVLTLMEFALGFMHVISTLSTDVSLSDAVTLASGCDTK
jgi:hypothetical protein